MADLLQWLTHNPIVIVLISVIILVIVLMYLVAFLQGREVSFWPPKIGSKENVPLKQKDKSPVRQKPLLDEKLIWHNDIPINHEGISNAKTIDWMSITLNRTFPIIKADVYDCIKGGGLIRILLVDPESEVPNVLANSGHFHGNTDKVVHSIETTIDQITAWKDEFPNSNIEVRLMPCPPPYRITIMDRHLAIGYLYARIPVFNNSKDIPTIAIKAEDKVWFDFFVDQYEKYWAISKPVSIKKKR